MILYVAWQDEASRSWHTIARLSEVSEGYELQFTNGVRWLRTLPEDLYNMRPGYRFLFPELLPVFKNRIPSKTRADYAKLLRWLDADPSSDDFTLLSKFGPIPGTDSMLLYPVPTVENGMYRVDFFVHGMRHMHKDVVDLCARLRPGDQLLPLLDVQNEFDPHATAVRLKQPGSLLIGYVPVFYSADFHKILASGEGPVGARLSVLSNNDDAPIQIRLRCRFEAQVPTSFKVLDTEEHLLLAKPGSLVLYDRPKLPAARRNEGETLA